MSIHQNLALIGLEQTDDEIEACGFTGTVWPQKTDHFTRFQRQREVLHQRSTSQGERNPIETETHGVRGVCAG